ncbi:MAG: D-ribose pyranase [Anaerolineae bacterium]
MKKRGILHPELSRVIAELGHTDTIVIADAGLPIPDGPARIDLAVVEGVPPFLMVLQAVLGDMQVEEATIAEEMVEASPEFYEQVTDMLGSVSVNQVMHQAFKLRTRDARAVIRTGEFTPYANIILHAGVVF